MDGATFRERVEAEMATELDGLGSEKLLPSLTGAELERAAVLEAAADSEYAARETFRAWAEDEADPDAAAAFEATAEQEDDHLNRVREVLTDPYDLRPRPVPSTPTFGGSRGRSREWRAGRWVGRSRACDPIYGW